MLQCSFVSQRTSKRNFKTIILSIDHHEWPFEKKRRVLTILTQTIMIIYEETRSLIVANTIYVIVHRYSYFKFT